MQQFNLNLNVRHVCNTLLYYLCNERIMNQILFFLFKNNFSLNLIVENLLVFDWYTDINFTAEAVFIVETLDVARALADYRVLGIRPLVLVSKGQPSKTFLHFLRRIWELCGRSVPYYHIHDGDLGGYRAL